MIFLRLDGNRIMDICEAPPCPDGYVPLAVAAYPNDLMTQAYRLDGDVIIKDEALYSEYLSSLEGD
jgi:hypothetical protein